MDEKTGDFGEFEYCTNCDANLTLQKGFSSDLPYWVCKGCGQMLFNKDLDFENNTVWICDECGEVLNIQEGFSADCVTWECAKCGFANEIDEKNLYSSQEEYLASLNDPYKGLSDEEVLALLSYEEIGPINDRPDIILVKNTNGDLFVKKILRDYDLSIYKFLMANPIDNMPRLVALFEGSNNLIILEEYVAGRTVSEILEEGPLERNKAVYVVKSLCKILMKLHSSEKAIIHRDIKPSNIIITPDDKVFLLDINVAKWYKPEEAEDTKMFGTLYYAAPEQLGYGFLASSEKSDIYALGMLLNVMLTGKLPKEKKAPGAIWPIISKCISLEPENRYTAKEFLAALEGKSKAINERTYEVEELLKSMRPGQLDDFYEENRANMVDEKKAFYYYMKDIMESKNILLKDIYIYAGVSESYGEKIIRMEKHTKNRDLILRLCVAGHFSLSETNKALKLYGMNPLYAKDRRDACLIVAINNRIFDYADINEILEKQGFARLSSE